jgi:hypothetical protein
MATLMEIMGQAYHRTQVAADRRGAIQMMRDAFLADEKLKQQAEAELDRIDAMHAMPGSRFQMSVGGRTTCHVTSVQRDLLKAVLGR